MKQDIIAPALNKIRAKKLQAQAEFDRLMAPVYADEQYQEANKQYVRLVIENARLQASNEKANLTEQAKLEDQLAKIKAKYGITQTKPSFACKNCDDNGYKNGEMCVCLKKEISRHLLKDSGFEKLEDFDTSTKTSGNLAPVYNKMKEWCNANSAKNLIYFAGATGVGKTHLMQCMANEFIEQGRMVKIVTAFKMNQDFRDFSKSFDEDLLNKYIECEVLFVDDLGTEPMYRNVTIEYLYLVINERKMKKLKTIITSNLDLSDIRDRYDERIFSRIADRQTSINLLLTGDDKRLNLKKQ